MYVWGSPGLRFRDIYGCIRAYGSEFAYPTIVRGGSKTRHTFCGGHIQTDYTRGSSGCVLCSAGLRQDTHNGKIESSIIIVVVKLAVVVIVIL